MLRRSFIPLLFLVAFAATTPAGAGPADLNETSVYFAAQQNPGTDHAAGAGAWDAGFEFQTTEVVLAIAETAQSDPHAWNAAEARSAVVSFTNGDGVNPLAFLDDVAEAGVDPGTAAKLLLLVGEPLAGVPGFETAAWDPAGDGNPVDLRAALDGGCGDDPADYGFFGQTLVGMQAKAVICGHAGPAAVATVRAAQQVNGGWSYDGDPSGVTDADVDTTAAAVLALEAAELDAFDLSVGNALAFLAEHRDPAGWWPGYDGEPSPDSTSRAMLAIKAAGYDPTLGAWRGIYEAPCDAPGASGYVSPDAALGDLQQLDGSIAGPTTFSAVYATAQAVQGLERNWLPVRQAVVPPPPPSLPAVCGTTLPAPSGSIEPPGPPGSGDPQLPRTGNDITVWMVAGVLSLAIGSGLVVRRRRVV